MHKMSTSDFYYDLPEELIAQTPVEPRNHSRLMVLSKKDDSIEHRHFYDLCDYLKKGDLLILNDSRVLPARLYGEKIGTGSAIEFLLLEQKDPHSCSHKTGQTGGHTAGDAGITSHAPVSTGDITFDPPDQSGDDTGYRIKEKSC